MNEVIMLHIIFLLPYNSYNSSSHFQLMTRLIFLNFPSLRAIRRRIQRTSLLFFEIYSVLLLLEKIFISKYFLFSLIHLTLHARQSTVECWILSPNKHTVPREGAATQTRQITWKNFTPTHKNNSKQLQRRVHSVSLAFSLALLKIFEISHSLSTELHILHHNIPPTPSTPFKLTVLSQKPYANFLMLSLPTLYA